VNGGKIPNGICERWLASVDFRDVCVAVKCFIPPRRGNSDLPRLGGICILPGTWGIMILPCTRGNGVKVDKALRSAQDIGPLVRFLRKSENLTQEQLSKITGLKQQTISAIESGAQEASLKTIFTLLSTLNLELVVRPRKQYAKGYAPGRKL
jgi:HTH-type transcriptional regulator/antitoxin HipB